MPSFEKQMDEWVKICKARMRNPTPTPDSVSVSQITTVPDAEYNEPAPEPEAPRLGKVRRMEIPEF